MVARLRALGMNFQPLLDNGAITIRQIDPGELSPGEFGYYVRQGVTENDARVVIIDSLNGYLNAMPDERFLTIQLHELLAYLGQKNVISLLTTVQQGILGASGSPIEPSYMADTVVTLRYFEAMGRVKRAISVVKKRSGPHEDTIREFQIDAGGIRLGEPLTEFQGVLSGIPTFHGSKESTM